MQRDFVTTCRPLEFFTENPYHPLNLASPSATHSRKSKSTSKLAALPAAPTRPVHRFHLSFPRAPNGPYSGCFARFPRYLIDPYRDRPPELRAKSKSDRPWRPTGRPVVRAKFTESVVEKVTRIACNSSNFADYREQVYPLYWGEWRDVEDWGRERVALNFSSWDDKDTGADDGRGGEVTGRNFRMGAWRCRMSA